MENLNIEKILSDIKLTDISKELINKTAINLTLNVQEGFEDAIDLDVKLKFIEEIIKSSRELINSQVIKEAEEVKDRLGIKIQVKRGYPKYNFKEDVHYLELLQKAEQREQLLKEAVKTSHQILTEDGEIVPKCPVISYTKDSVSYIFRK